MMRRGRRLRWIFAGEAGLAGRVVGDASRRRVATEGGFGKKGVESRGRRRFYGGRKNSDFWLAIAGGVGFAAQFRTLKQP